MAAIPGSVDTDQQPPMTVPLRHFLVAIGFLLAGVLVGLGQVVGFVPGMATAAQLHLLLAGWVCITIMGAMTQFVPVWSGVELHSERLASLQLSLVVAGLAGFAPSLLLGAYALVPVFGVVMLAGFWTFVYNVGRTLLRVEGLDVTERHFAFSLACFVALTVLGPLLAIGFTQPVFDWMGVARPNVLLSHATLAVFGAVLTTVYGALYQLATMFTQTELHGADHYLKRVEVTGHPVGVVLLAGGRLVGDPLIARAGAVLVVLGALAMSAIVARRLVEMAVPWTPMHTRYALAAPALAAWALLSAPALLDAPLARGSVLGAPGAVHLLALGAIGFVVFGTLYHIVPFIVWVHRYSDLLGFEDVPMIDDLYDDRLAVIDASMLSTGTALLVLAEWFQLWAGVSAAGGTLVLLGILVFGTNLLGVLREHSPQGLGEILLGSVAPPRNPDPIDDAEATENSGD